MLDCGSMSPDESTILKKLLPTTSIILTCTHATSSKAHHNMHENKLFIISSSHAHIHFMTHATSHNMHGKVSHYIKWPTTICMSTSYLLFVLLMHTSIS